MKKRTKFIIAVAIIILVFACFFIPFNNKKEIVIKAQLYDVAKQINDLNNWKKWNTDFKKNDIKITGDYTIDQSGGTMYVLHHINPLAVTFIKKTGINSTLSLISISPQTDSFTNVAWFENETLFKIIKQSFSKNSSRKINLNNLKKLMEDVNYKYGFFIRIVPVKDTLILTAEAELNNYRSTNVVADLYQTLQSFIIKNKLPAETKYFYKTMLSNNKIAVGIPVYKQINNDENIKFLKLPAIGRLVEGTYSGKLAGKQSIYNSINSFMLDQHLKQVAKPLEQYNVADTILNADNNINIKIFYPIF